MHTFAEKGFAATKVADVAKRAGVSKGLLYLYFKTKEDLFKAVVRSFVFPMINNLTDTVEKTDLGAEDFIRGPLLNFAITIPNSPAKYLVRLLVAEGPKHPDLVAWYWENVAAKGIKAIRTVVEKGVENGEFKPNAFTEIPHIFATPIVFSVLWKILFDKHDGLDTDRLIEEHFELILQSIRKKAC